MKDFRKLAVWHKAHEFVLQVYRESRQFPREEIYGLTSQLRRAAASIPANIAEGCGKATDPDLARYLQNAFGSANECEYHLLLSRDIGILPVSDHIKLEERILEIKRMLGSLIVKIRDDVRSK